MKTLGTAVLEGGRWVVEAPPHVLLRIKRNFPVRQTSLSCVDFSDTLDTCRDLHWFCQRYPLKVKPRAYLEKRAAEYDERDVLVDRLLRGKRKPMQFEMAYPPRDYQRIAAELALASRGLLLADELGLGKTVTAISFLTDPNTRPALVVVPAHLQRQWAAEIAKFAPNLTTHILKQSLPYDYTGQDKSAQLPLLQSHPDVLISSYHKISGWAETLAPVLKSIVFDEAQELRGGPYRGGNSVKKNIAASFLAQSVDFRLGLSATPIYNYGSEIYNVLNVLRPGALGTSVEFNREWCVGRHGAIEEPKAFGSYARSIGLILRRTRADVGRELPELVKVPHSVDADAKPLDEVESPAMELARLIMAGREEVTRAEAFNASGQLEGLVRQATGIAKAPHVAAFVKLLLESGEKVVLFGWHREVYGIWLEQLKKYSPALYTGTESPRQKDEAKRRFCEDLTPLLIVSLRSGLGLDGLQYANCRTVVHGELDWSPSVHEQCSGRVHRDGIEQSVLAYYLITDVGSDPIVADVLGLKKAQLQGLRDPFGHLSERVDTTGARVRALAESYLLKARKGAA